MRLEQMELTEQMALLDPQVQRVPRAHLELTVQMVLTGPLAPLALPVLPELKEMLVQLVRLEHKERSDLLALQVPRGRKEMLVQQDQQAQQVPTALTERWVLLAQQELPVQLEHRVSKARQVLQVQQVR